MNQKLPNEKRFILRFIGNKQELHTQLKVWCAENKMPMNDRIIDLISESLKK